MTSTAEPDTMTADERRDEVAGILANGLLRRIRAAESAASSPAKTVAEESRKGLELPAETGLSVAPRPAG